MSFESEKIKVIIVDDEKLVRDYLRRIILERKDIVIIGEAEDGTEAISKVQELSPDIMLLDIQMPELDGFDVLDFLDEPPPTIFVTAYDEYAIQAFEVNAVDYVLKPVIKKRLFDAIEKAKIYIQKKKIWESEVARILNYTREKPISKIAIRIKGAVKLLNLEEICWISADGDYSSIHIANNDFFHKKSLKLLESQLPLYLFSRVHRSYIVNLKKVKELIFDAAGGYRLKMIDDSEIPVARRKSKEIKKKLKI
ncbi:MAG: LytTR family DNA-binding domain-containing protein [candidate division WOR-3 bacterium]